MKTKKKLYKRQNSKKNGGSNIVNEELLKSLGLNQNNINKTMKQFDISLLSKNELLNLLQLSHDCDINTNYNGRLKKYKGFVEIYIHNEYNSINLKMVDNLLLYLDYFDIKYIKHKTKGKLLDYNNMYKKIDRYYIQIFMELEEYNKFIKIMYSKYSHRCHIYNKILKLNSQPLKPSRSLRTSAPEIPNSLVLRRQ